MNKAKLLACPMCGKEAGIERPGTARQSMIIACTNCGCSMESGDVVGLTPPEQYAWNVRAGGRKPETSATGETKHVCISDLLDGWTWTQTKPTKCGYYWVKGKALHNNPRIMRFKVLAKMGGGECIQPVDGPLSTSGWQWFCGPIPKPSEWEYGKLGTRVEGMARKSGGEWQRMENLKPSNND